MSYLNNHFVPSTVLKINVGFLLHEAAGASREIAFDVPEIRLDDTRLDYMRGNVRLTRTARGILVQGQLLAGYKSQCVRCLKETSRQINLEIEDIFVFPPTPQAEFAVYEDGFLDLAPLLREETIVHMPIHVVCMPECRGLCPSCGTDLNTDVCACEQDNIDPRFAVLKQMQTHN